MDIQTEKLRLIAQLLKTDDIGIISKIKAIFSSKWKMIFGMN